MMADCVWNLPVHQAVTPSQAFVHSEKFAASLFTVRMLEIYQSNNEVDVIGNRLEKIVQQKYGNNCCGNRITTPKGPQVFNNLTRTMFFFFCYRNP